MERKSLLRTFRANDATVSRIARRVLIAPQAVTALAGML